MKNSIFIALCVLIIPACAHAQIDSILAVNVFAYEINENGQRTSNKNILYQNTYTSENLLNQTLFYDSALNISHHTYFYYESGRLISSESYDVNHEIDSIRRYSYDSDGLKNREELYVRYEEELEFAGSITFLGINGTSFPISIENNKGKKITKTTFSSTDNTLIINTKYKKKSRADNLVSLTETRFLSNNSIDSSIIQRQYPNEVTRTKIVYEYENANTSLKSKTWYNEQDKIVRKEEFSYNRDGQLTMIESVDGEGKYLAFMVFQNKPHVVNLVKPEMYTIPKN